MQSTKSFRSEGTDTPYLLDGYDVLRRYLMLSPTLEGEKRPTQEETNEGENGDNVLLSSNSEGTREQTWKGPYIVNKAFGNGTYKITTTYGYPINQMVNNSSLRGDKAFANRGGDGVATLEGAEVFDGVGRRSDMSFLERRASMGVEGSDAASDKNGKTSVARSFLA
ncbi:hypothetical protein Tco_0841211 [Tanacetum coccineum]|uniref:Uncharacterized protein n=1 Tax=Tanacetum coccineum TaxID=301880 RepID=A0ABQ5B050_9ASTR